MKRNSPVLFSPKHKRLTYNIFCNLICRLVHWSYHLIQSKIYFYWISLWSDLNNQFFFISVVWINDISVRVADNLSLSHPIPARRMDMPVNPVHRLMFQNKIFEIWNISGGQRIFLKMRRTGLQTRCMMGHHNILQVFCLLQAFLQPGPWHLMDFKGVNRPHPGIRRVTPDLFVIIHCVLADRSVIPGIAENWKIRP